jgi:hypothetical protein
MMYTFDKKYLTGFPDTFGWNSARVATSPFQRGVVAQAHRSLRDCPTQDSDYAIGPVVER